MPEPVRTCPACSAPLHFAKSPSSEKKIPLDSRAACYRIVDGVAVRVDDVFVTHFATCSDPERFHRQRQPPAKILGPPDAADARRLGRRLGATAALVITFGQGRLGGSSWGDSRGASDEAANQLRTILAHLTASAPERDARLEERRRDPLGEDPDRPADALVHPFRRSGQERMLEDLAKHVGRALTSGERERVLDVFRNKPGEDGPG